MTTLSGSSGSGHTDSSHNNDACSGDLSRYISSPLPQMFVLSALLVGSVVPLPQVHAQTGPEAVVNRDLGPTVTILSPQYSDLIKDKTQVLIAVKTTNYAPEFVEMFVDDRPVTYDPVNKTSKVRLESVPSAAFDWVTTRFTDGPHNLKVRVTDTQGFIGEADVTVYINNGTGRDTTAPVLEWLNIQSGQVLSGKVDVQLQAVDDYGVKYVIVVLNSTETPDRKPPAGAWFMNRPPYTVRLDTRTLPDGTYVMKGTGYDVRENEGYSLPLFFGISNNAINATTIQGRIWAIIGAPKAAPTAEPKAVPVPDPTPVAQAPQQYAALPNLQNEAQSQRGVSLPVISVLSSERKGAAKMQSALSSKSSFSPLRPERHLNASMPPRYARLPQPIALALGAPPQPANSKVFTAPAPSGTSATRINNSANGSTRSTLPPEAGRVAPQSRVAATVAPWNPSKHSVPNTATSKSGKIETPRPPVAIKPVPRMPDANIGTLIAAGPKPPVQQGVANTINPVTTLRQRTKQGAITEAPLALRRSEPARLVSLRLSSPSGLGGVKMATAAASSSSSSKVTEVTVLPTGGQSTITSAASKSRAGETGQSGRPPAMRASLPRVAFSPDLSANRGAKSTANSITVTPITAGSTPGALPASYVAQRNETLTAIAKRFDLPVGVLAANNKMKVDASVAKGTRIKLPQTLMLSYEGKPVTSDVAPMLVDSTSVAAFRFLFEKQGGVMTWDPIQQQIKAHNDKHEVTLTIGSKQAVVNQQEVMMDLAAFLLSGRTMVPIRFFEKALHAQVDWEPSTGRIYVAMTN